MPAQALKRWETKASTGSHFDVLDGLRGMAILLVVASHSLYTNPADGLLAKLVGFIIVAGWMGVPIFFVLSGFLISLPFFQQRNMDPSFWYLPGYVGRRIGKIIPPFYLSIILFMVFYWWQFHDPSYFKSAAEWALGLGNFISISPNFNGVYWSLVVESHFYIILPILFWLTRQQTIRTTTVILFLILFIVPLVARCLTWPKGLFVLPNYDTNLYSEMWLKLHRFPCELDYFAWGVGFAGIYVSLAIVREKLCALSLFGYMGMGMMLVTLVFWGLWDNQFDIRARPPRWAFEIGHWLPAISAMLMLFFIFDANSLGARFFNQRWLRFTGIISYEWFLFHGPIVFWFHEHTGASHGNLLAFLWRTIVPLALTFVFSVIIYWYFSLPILRRIRNRLLASTQNAPPA